MKIPDCNRDGQPALPASPLLGRVPPKHTGCKEWRKLWPDNGVTKILATLEVGGSVKLSRKFWGCVRVISDRLEIKTVTRSLGSKDEITVYRVA